MWKYIVAMLLLWSSVANAASTPVTVDYLPTAMAGHWCFLKHHDKFTVYRKKEQDCRDTDGWFEFDTKRFDA